MNKEEIRSVHLLNSVTKNVNIVSMEREAKETVYIRAMLKQSPKWAT